MKLIQLVFFCTLTVFSAAVRADDWTEAMAAMDAEDFGRAIALMTPLAEAGHVDAQDELSHIYWFGDGVPVDYEIALDWTKRAIELNSSTAMYNIAVHYIQGRAVPRNEAIGRGWLERAAKAGDTWAHYNLFIMKWSGQGGAVNPVQALTHLEKAASSGYPPALTSLGLAYMLGDLGHETNLNKARHYLTDAADQRDIAGMAAAGSLLSLPGENADYLHAAIYLRGALADDCYAAFDQLLRVIAVMPLDDLLSFDTAYADWLLAHPRPEQHSHSSVPEGCLLRQDYNPT